MKFSVIVPVYNVEAFLPNCVDSILQQEHPDFEVILVNDGSTDNSAAVCDRYAQTDYRVRVIHKENGGASDARNFGMDAASGDYLLFVDSDDFWSSSKVLSTVEGIILNTNATIVQYGVQIYLNQDKSYLPVGPRNLSQYNGQNQNLVLYELVRRGELTISACTIAISAAFVKEHNVYFTKGVRVEDLEWAIRLYVHKPVWAFSDEYFYVYRKQRAGSVTDTIDYKHLCDYCWIIENMISLLEQNGGWNREALLSYMLYHVLICCALCYRSKISAEQRKDILRRMKAVCKGRMGRYTVGKKVKLGSLCYRLLGFRTMAAIVGFYLNHRGH